MYLSKLPYVFVQIAKSICPNCQKNISGTQYAQVQDSGDGEGEEGDGGGRRGEEQEEGQESVNIRIVFVQIAKCICPNCQKIFQALNMPTRRRTRRGTRKLQHKKNTNKYYRETQMSNKHMDATYISDMNWLMCNPHIHVTVNNFKIAHFPVSN